MAWNHIAAPQTIGNLGNAARRIRALGLALLFLTASGCEALDRMDYLDRFFEAAYQPNSVSVAAPQPDAAATLPAGADPQREPLPFKEPRPNPAPASAVDRASQPGATRATEPRPNPAPLPESDTDSRARLAVRQHHWLTLFWTELTPVQQTRVERQLNRASVQLAGEQADPAAIWDTMGLTDRVALVFGNNWPVDRPAPAEQRSRSVWAGRP